MDGSGDPRSEFDRLDREREALGIPQAILCRHANINEATYSILRKEPTRQPRYRTLASLRQALALLKERAA